MATVHILKLTFQALALRHSLWRSKGWYLLVRSLFRCLYIVFFAPLAKQEQFILYALGIFAVPTWKIFKITVWLTGSTREPHETRKLPTSVLGFHTCTYLAPEWKPNPIFILFSFSLFFWQILTNAKHILANVM